LRILKFLTYEKENEIGFGNDIIGKTKIPSDFPDISKDNLEK